MRHRLKIKCPVCSLVRSARWDKEPRPGDPLLRMYTHSAPGQEALPRVARRRCAGSYALVTWNGTLVALAERFRAVAA